MSYIIFCISVICIVAICFTMHNCCFIDKEKESKGELKIILTKENVDFDEKKEIINKIMNGEFEDILDVVDNMRIN